MCGLDPFLDSDPLQYDDSSNLGDRWVDRGAQRSKSTHRSAAIALTAAKFSIRAIRAAVFDAQRRSHFLVALIAVGGKLRLLPTRHLPQRCEVLFWVECVCLIVRKLLENGYSSTSWNFQMRKYTSLETSPPDINHPLEKILRR